MGSQKFKALFALVTILTVTAALPADPSEAPTAQRWRCNAAIGVRRGQCIVSAKIASRAFTVRIRIGYELSYQCPQPVPMILMLHVHPTRTPDLLQLDDILTDPPVALSSYRDGFGNRCTRLIAPPGRITLKADAVISDSGTPEATMAEAPQLQVESLPDAILSYLLGSRYCDTDHLSEMAWAHFGHTRPGWERVQAICDFVHRHIAFRYDAARATMTASEAFHERCGVCRDYAHLAISLCRCLNIPARYCSGYLGDIGVPRVDLPMDFSAWFEAYLGGHWHTFDARHNIPRIGRILIARGRDAADVAISTTFGPCSLTGFRVWSDELPAARA